MIEKVMNRPKILKIVDEEILPLLDNYRKEEDEVMKRIGATMLLEFEDIFEYHFPEDFQDCKKLIKKHIKVKYVC